MVQAQESNPFRAEPPRILHHRKCPPPPGGRATELKSVHEVTKELCDMVWVLQKPRGEDRVFWTERVKEYPTTRFNIGEERLRQADLVQVAADMTMARETVGGSRFKRSE